MPMMKITPTPEKISRADVTTLRRKTETGTSETKQDVNIQKLLDDLLDNL